MKLVIGLAGEFGCGKKGFCDVFTEVAQKRGYTVEVFETGSGGVISHFMRRAGISFDRAQSSRIVEALTQTFGNGIIADAMGRAIDGSSVDIAIYDALRTEADVDKVRSYGQGHYRLVFLDVDPQVTYTRVKDRNRHGEADMTWGEFCEHRNLPTERYIRNIKAMRDCHVIENSGTFDAFRLNVERYFEQQVAQFLPRRVVA